MSEEDFWSTAIGMITITATAAVPLAVCSRQKKCNITEPKTNNALSLRNPKPNPWAAKPKPINNIQTPTTTPEKGKNPASSNDENKESDIVIESPKDAPPKPENKEPPPPPKLAQTGKQIVKDKYGYYVLGEVTAGNQAASEQKTDGCDLDPNAILKNKPDHVESRRKIEPKKEKQKEKTKEENSVEKGSPAPETAKVQEGIHKKPKNPMEERTQEDKTTHISA